MEDADNVCFILNAKHRGATVTARVDPRLSRWLRGFLLHIFEVGMLGCKAPVTINTLFMEELEADISGSTCSLE